MSSKSKASKGKEQKSVLLTTSPLDELRVTHANLMERGFAVSKADRANYLADVKSFTEQIKASGTVISDLLDRREAQGILDYWSSHLVSNGGVDLKTWSQPRLAAYDKAQSSTASPADIANTKAELEAIDEKNRQLVRFSALARQWRMQGKSKGYLLGGDALKNAIEFRGKDKDVDELIAASETYTQVRNRNWRWGALAVISALLLLIAVLIYQYLKLIEASRELENASTELDIQNSELRESNKDLLNSNFQLAVKEKELNTTVAELRRANAELQKQLSRNKRLGNAISDLRIQELRTTRGFLGQDVDSEEIVANLRLDRSTQNTLVPKIKPLNLDIPRNLKLPEPSSYSPIILPNPATFDIGTEEDRLSAALGYNKLLRGKDTSPADQLTLAKSLVAMTSHDVFGALSPEGQHYLLFILSLAPAQYWDLPAWSTIRDDVRKNLDVLESQSITIDKKSQQYLDALQSYVAPINVLKQP